MEVEESFETVWLTGSLWNGFRLAWKRACATGKDEVLPVFLMARDLFYFTPGIRS